MAAARIDTSTGRRPTAIPEPKLGRIGTAHGKSSRKMWLDQPSERVMSLGGIKVPEERRTTLSTLDVNVLRCMLLEQLSIFV